MSHARLILREEFLKRYDYLKTGQEGFYDSRLSKVKDQNNKWAAENLNISVHQKPELVYSFPYVQ